MPHTETQFVVTENRFCIFLTICITVNDIHSILHIKCLEMIPLMKTIIVSFQMLERWAGGQNPLNSFLHGCEDLNDPDCFLDYQDDLNGADCSELTADYRDSSFQLLDEDFQRTDYSMRNLACDTYLRHRNLEPKICDVNEEFDTDECFSDTSFSRTRAENLHLDSYGKITKRAVSGEKNSSSSLVSCCKDETQLPKSEEFRSSSSPYLKQHHVDRQTSSHPGVDENMPCDCCFCAPRNAEDFQQRIVKKNYPRQLRKKSIQKRKTTELLGNSSQPNSSDEDEFIVSEVQSGFEADVFPDNEAIDCTTAHDLNPECSVCFRKHAEQDDDVTFSCYGILPDCQHSFCQSCISSWLQQSAIDRWRCPVCRTPVLFTFVSKLWLPHNTDEKIRQLSSTRSRQLLARMVLKKATALLRLLLFYWRIGVKALRNLIEEISPEFEPLLHRHEIGAFV
ncbi:Zinc finger RING-type [Trinorchestia longiramus]|nr:Zinc finger RING-type [Trinorchestia longiramus]